MQKNNIQKLLFLSITLGVAFVVAFNIFFIFLITPGSLENNKILIIKPKTSINQITDKLYSEGVITNKILFKICAKTYSKFRFSLKSGEYQFNHNISPIQVLRILGSGKSILHKFVIPEGVTISEIVHNLYAEDKLSGELHSDIEEGSLMPSTYFYTYQDQRAKLISQMQKLMDDVLEKAVKKLDPGSPIKTKEDILILASIVEKEALLDEEKPKIARVFLNRLQRGMKLQADPTTIYAITEGKYKLDRQLTRRDLMIKSDYNTYYKYGLPIKPISCPGIKSIEAVASPAISNDLYFVVDGTGSHVFAADLKSHNNNVKSYKKFIANKKNYKVKK